MNKQRLEQLFSGLLVLSFFLPWVDNGSISLSAMQYPGFVLGISGNGQAAFLYALYLIPVLAVAVILFSFQGKNTNFQVQNAYNLLEQAMTTMLVHQTCTKKLKF